MKLLSVALWCGVAMALLLVTTFAIAAEVQIRNFDRDQPEKLPPGFQIGTLFDGRPAGDWQVIASDKATSPPPSLGSASREGGRTCLQGVAGSRHRIRECRSQREDSAYDGKADMGGGLIWRATDERNYYLARANPLEQNIRIYRVVKGVRHMLQNFNHIIDIHHWHQLQVRMEGCNIQVSFDERPVFKLCDKTFTKGRIGLWTKSDAVTYFDDLQLEASR